MEKTKTLPIFLIDDLFAKLDRGRSKRIISLLEEIKDRAGDPIQTIITTTDLLTLTDNGIQLKMETHEHITWKEDAAYKQRYRKIIT